MITKTKNLSVRLTQEQFRKLAEVIIAEQRNKSLLVRDALDAYLSKNHDKSER
jgi:metal-responsive CopG/Arc/MetJ family transcriptional regulator